MLSIATRIVPENVSDASLGGYWAAVGLVAIGGLVMALSQLLGGWTKWGWPRVSGHVFLVGFLPTLVVGGWMLAAHEPANYWLGRHVRSWSGDMGIDDLMLTTSSTSGVGDVPRAGIAPIELAAPSPNPSRAAPAA